MMLNFLSTFDPTIPEALILALFGFAFVCAVLGVLIGLLFLFQKVMQIDFKKKKNIEVVSKLDDDTVDSYDDEVVAAITAAITVMYSESSSEAVVPPFKIKNIKLK